MAHDDSDAKSRHSSPSDDPGAMQNAYIDGREDIEEKSMSPLNETATRPPFSPLREIAFVFSICMAQFLALAGLAQSIAPLPILGQSFGVTDEGLLSWYPAAFSLTVGTFILPAGRLGDMYGHRTIALIGYAWYAIWSIIAGVAVYSGDVLFSFARGMQGVGPALVVPNALALVGIAYGASPRKNMVFALFGAAAPTGWVVGAVFSSVLAQLAWWPWAFFILAFVCAGMIVLNLVVVPADAQKHSASFSEFDALGCVTGVSGLVLFNFAWNQAAVVGWQEPYTYALLIVGILLLVVFANVELRIAKNPLVPLKGMAGEAALALGVIAAGWASFGIWVFYLWRLIENLRGYSPLAATAQNAPVAVSGLLAAVATGFLLSHIKISYTLLISTLFFLTGQILISTVPVDQIYWAQTFVSIILMPWGMDMSFPSATVLLSNNTPSHDQGIASSLINTTVNYSISLGLGIAGTIVRQVSSGGADTLAGYRGAWYFGIGLDVLAVAIAAYFVVKH
ncbi:MFS general substrate transporter [Polychaeton citri CBS 116435]|uniref:MFS general substrate transporter n=1 Tax=Polychaeton citri CBS 116435 TaxID=1314669 RepID=A0A9P4UV91_9PEZI|nr:MFS general substrate transporter [Polychaeton citri CBS 116435]